MKRHETAEKRQTVGIGELYVATNFVNHQQQRNAVVRREE